MKKTALRIDQDDIKISMMQDRVLDAIDKISSLPLMDCVLIHDVSLVSGDNTIAHTLLRRLTGWWLTRRSAAVTVYDKQSANLIPDKTLVLNSSGTATVDIMVF